MEKKDKDFVSINYDSTKRPRTQDINEQYLETGSFYITKKEMFCVEIIMLLKVYLGFNKMVWQDNSIQGRRFYN